MERRRKWAFDAVVMNLRLFCLKLRILWQRIMIADMIAAEKPSWRPSLHAMRIAYRALAIILLFSFIGWAVVIRRTDSHLSVFTSFSRDNDGFALLKSLTVQRGDEVDLNPFLSVGMSRFLFVRRINQTFQINQQIFGQGTPPGISRYKPPATASFNPSLVISGFPVGSATIPADANIDDFIKSCELIYPRRKCRFLCIGNTDRFDANGHNGTLAESRGQAVAELLTKHNVPAKHILVSHLESADPLDYSNTPEGDGLNRSCWIICFPAPLSPF